jgi:hypothetical protein
MSMLLVRILVARIKNRQRLESTLKSTPLRPEVDGWNCVGWAEEALEKVLADSSVIGTAAEGWQSMQDTAMGVCREEEEHWFDGTVEQDPTKAPTWDLVGAKELSP